MKKIRIAEVKQALRDPEFRKKLPPELKADIQKYEQNPGCPCNLPIYQNILKKGGRQLLEYFLNHEVTNPDEELAALAQNHFTVINCHVDELEVKLKALPPGRKQLGIARYNDQVTVIVNELDLLF